MLLGSGPSAWASDFYVHPIRIVLGAQTPSVLLTIQNTASDPLRFQLNVFTWEQTPAGELILAPTRDIIFFPKLLTLAPGEQRIVRVGTAAPASPVEKAYRLFVEELPPFESEGQSSAGTVRVRARVGLPIFVPPANGRPAPRLAGTVVRRGHLSFELQNPGTVHVAPEGVRARGYGAGGEVVWEYEFEGWYVLANGRRTYAVDISRADCAKLHALAIEVTTGSQTLMDRVDLQADACAP